MELWLDILMDALIDSIKLFPFLLLTYLLMEYLEHKTSTKTRAWIRKAGRLGPIAGGGRRNFSTMWIFGSRFKSVLRWNHYDGNAGGSVFIDLG